MSNSIEIYKFVFHWQNMLHKKFNQEDLATFFKQRIDSWERKSLFTI